METNQPIQSPIAPTFQPPPLTPKKKIPWLVIVLVVFLLSATGAFAYQNYQLKQQLNNQSPTLLPFPQVVISSPSPVTSPTSEIDPTAGWNKNTLANLSFKYPKTWTLNTINAGKHFQLKPQNKDNPEISIYTMDNPQNLPLSQFGSDWEIKPNLYSTNADKKIISGITGYYQADQNCEPLFCDKFAISIENKIYVAVITYSGITKEELNLETKEYRPVFDQILSTFEFID